jgi:DnaJ domain
LERFTNKVSLVEGADSALQSKYETKLKDNCREAYIACYADWDVDKPMSEYLLPNTVVAKYCSSQSTQPQASSFDNLTLQPVAFKPAAFKPEPFKPATTTLAEDSGYLLRTSIAKIKDSNGNVFKGEAYLPSNARAEANQKFEKYEADRLQTYEETNRQLETQHKLKMEKSVVEMTACGTAGAALGSSTVRNGLAYYRGDKSAAEAVQGVVVNTAKGGFGGALVGCGMVVIGNHAKTIAPFATYLVPCVTFAAEASQAILNWYNGKISVQECAKSVGKSFVVQGVSLASSIAVGAAVGSAAGPLGAFVGGVAGGFLVTGATLAYDHVLDWIDNKSKAQVLEEAYKFLGVTSNASNHAINAAYKELAKICHPDKGGTHESMTRRNCYMEGIRADRGATTMR